MSGSCQLEGAQFPTDPIEQTWTRERLATRGDGVPVWSIYWSWEGKFGHLEQADWNWFLSYFMEAESQTVVLPAPGSEQLTRYSGVAFAICQSSHRDFHGWFMEPTITFQHIYVSGGIAI